MCIHISLIIFPEDLSMRNGVCGKLLLLVLIVLLGMGMMVTAHAVEGSQPSNMKEWSPNFVTDYFQYYMNFDSIDASTGAFLDEQTSAKLYRRWLGLFENGSEFASSASGKAGNFGKFWYIPLINTIN